MKTKKVERNTLLEFPWMEIPLMSNIFLGGRNIIDGKFRINTIYRYFLCLPEISWP